MRNIRLITNRELMNYFGSPLGYIFAAIFVSISASLTFYFGHFFSRGIADLHAFFQYHPWLHLLLMPALGMRLWAEEIKTGTLECLMTLPIRTGEAVIGKFIAAWFFSGVILIFTFPLWITVNFIGNPDNGIILSTYLASWLMAGGFLALSACASASTNNQVVAFVVAVTVCFLFMMSGTEVVQAAFDGWAPVWLSSIIGNLSVMTNYDAISSGAIGLKNILYFASLIGLGLVVNATVVEIRRT
ncbi:MAG: ABC transporter permease [Rhodospirillaceae bacterium]|nr:ABC transporter permease [Rhodospirillaceae bacterium]|tara:strand:+ start:156 stop:887 length:732 start_codon:yes stop_codon:yes gene_type:complete